MQVQNTKYKQSYEYLHDPMQEFGKWLSRYKKKKITIVGKIQLSEIFTHRYARNRHHSH